MTLRLSQLDVKELMELEEGETFETTYKGLNIYITPNEYGQIEINNRKFEVEFFSPTDVNVIIKKNQET